MFSILIAAVKSVYYTNYLSLNLQQNDTRLIFVDLICVYFKLFRLIF